MDKENLWYVVKANLPQVFLPDQEYYIAQIVIDDYEQKGQIRDAIRECGI
jgi:hypothetical protein